MPKAQVTALLKASGTDVVLHEEVLRVRCRSKPSPNCAFARSSYDRSCTAAGRSDVRDVGRRCQHEARIRHQSSRGSVRIRSEVVIPSRFRTLVGKAIGNLWSSIVNGPNCFGGILRHLACVIRIYVPTGHVPDLDSPCRNGSAPKCSTIKDWQW